MIPTIGTNIRLRRIALGLKQSELGARRIPPLTQSRLSALELGLRPKAGELQRIATALGVDPADLTRTIRTPLLLKNLPGLSEAHHAPAE